MAPETQAAARLRLLIVDDDFLFTKMLPRELRKSLPDLDIACASSPDDAVGMLDAQAFDVVVCDYDLRALRNGLDVLGHAAKVAQPPFRILISGHSARDIPASTGIVDAFVPKPMTLRDIVPPLATLLKARLAGAAKT